MQFNYIQQGQEGYFGDLGFGQNTVWEIPRQDMGTDKKFQKVHSNKPMSGAGSPSCIPGSVQLNL